MPHTFFNEIAFDRKPPFVCVNQIFGGFTWDWCHLLVYYACVFCPTHIHKSWHLRILLPANSDYYPATSSPPLSIFNEIRTPFQVYYPLFQQCVRPWSLHDLDATSYVQPKFGFRIVSAPRASLKDWHFARQTLPFKAIFYRGIRWSFRHASGINATEKGQNCTL